MLRRLVVVSGAALAALLVSWGGPGVARADALHVVATTPDLAALARHVGGEEVEVTSLAKGPQDPHFVEARPSFIRELHDADLYVQIGMDLEIGWAPVLLRNARNPDVRPGARGYLDASAVIEPLEVPQTTVDRSMGDVHPYGNPHYLTDPINGLRVARLLGNRLAELRPARAEYFADRYEDFARRTAEALVGEALVTRHGADAIVDRVDRGTLEGFLSERGDTGLLAGWLGAFRPHAPVVAVQDHNLWPYFARRFGLELVETFEPRPGIAPTTRHLTRVIEVMEARDVRVILSSPYYDPRHARWVTERSEAEIARMAHQVGAQEGAEDYLSTVGHNVDAVLGAL